MSLLSRILPVSNTPNYFLVLSLTTGHIRAFIGEIQKDATTIVGRGEAIVSWGQNHLEAADEAISSAEKSLSAKILVEKTIILLPPSFFENHTIKAEYQAMMEKLATELGLSLVGYIDYPSIIIPYLETQEESAPTVLLFYIEKSLLSCFFVRVGKIHLEAQVPYTTVSRGLEEIIPKLGHEMLPSRIILCTDMEHEHDIREEFLNIPWHKLSVFLHTPKVEVLPLPDILAKSIPHIGSTLSFSTPTKTKTSHTPTHHEPETSSGGAQKTPVEETGFGFVKERDILLEKEPETPIEEESRTPPLSSPIEETSVPYAPPLLARLRFIVFSLVQACFRVRLPRFSLFIPVVFIMCLVGILGTFFALMKRTSAHVSLVAYPLRILQEKDIIVTSENTPIPSRLQKDSSIILAASTLTAQVSGEKNKQTTGKTNVGDKAKGNVTVYNKTLSAKTFPKGTVLKKDSLLFSLDEEVTLASASDTGEGLVYGKKDTTVTATRIGPEANIATEVSLIFQDFPESSYTAKSTKEFSGGTSREVDSVAKEDQQQLEANLLQTLQEDAKEKVRTQLPANTLLLDTFLQQETVEKAFSADVGEEARDVSLTMQLKVTAFALPTTILEKLTNDSITTPPEGYTVDLKRSSVDILSGKEDAPGIVVGRARITAFLIPTIDIKDLPGTIAGKTYQEVQNHLKTFPRIAGLRIFPQGPSLPFWVEHLPWYSENITVSVVTR